MKMKQKKKLLKLKSAQMKAKANVKVKPKTHLKAKTITSAGDITSLILRDHMPIKKLILTLKDSKVEISRKQPAYEEFKRALTIHAQAEEESLYVHMKEEDEGDDLRVEGYEGDTEHAIAFDLIQEIDEIRSNDDQWMAKVKVLAELVEHHIKEEENEFFKKIRKEFSTVERTEIGKEYSRLLNQFSADEDAEEEAEDNEKTKPKETAEIWA